MKKLLAALALPLALGILSAPVHAQDDASDSEWDASDAGDADETGDLDAMDDLAGMGALFAQMFQARPLDEAEEARLPLATSVVAKVFPEETYAQMMRDTISPMFSGFGAMALEDEAGDLRRATGLSAETVDAMSAEDVTAALAIIDPEREQRLGQLEEAIMPAITAMVSAIEPSYRAGLARAYAQRFTQEELAAVDAFFATPAGTRYAAQSTLVFTDPQVMAASMEAMPAMFEQAPELFSGEENPFEDVAQARVAADLSSEEQAQLATLMGVSVDDLLSATPGEEENFEWMEEEWGDENEADEMEDAPVLEPVD
jgi:hypothetical protein